MPTNTFVLHRDILGSNQHLLCSPKGYRWIQQIPATTWVYARKVQNSYCLRTLLRLNGFTLDDSVPKIYHHILRQTLKDVDEARVPWEDIMVRSDYLAFIKQFAEPGLEFLARCKTEYYQHFVSLNELFGSFVPAKIDKERYNNYLLQQHLGSRGPLHTFEPNTDGFAAPILYDRLGTSTGRLKVESGPEILILLREYRRILKSRFRAGRIVYLDFRALECRLLLSLLSVDLSKYDDVYQFLLDEIQSQYGIALSRNAIKEFVICVLYGMSIDSLLKNYTLDYSSISVLRNYIYKVFQFERISRDLIAQWQENQGKIQNFLGRVLCPHEPSPSLLLNYAVQSMAVDVALLGFDNIRRHIKEQGLNSQLLYILHDGLLLDVPPHELSCLPEFLRVGSQISHFSNSFPLSISYLG